MQPVDYQKKGAGKFLESLPQPKGGWGANLALKRRNRLSRFRLRLTTAGRTGCNPRVPRAGSLSSLGKDRAL